DPRDLRALRVVARDLDAAAGVHVRGAHVDATAGRDAQPPPALGAGLAREVVRLRGHDWRPGEHGVAEQPAAAGADAGQQRARVDHAREAQVVAGPAGDPLDVAAAGLVQGHRVGPGALDPRDGVG